MLLNQKATKEFIMEKCKALRPEWEVTAIKGDVCEILSAKLRALIEAEIKAHPNKGKTFTSVLGG